MHVKCKSCGKKFPVFPPSGDLNLGGQTLNLGGQNVDVNKITFGEGGRINFTPGSKITFRSPPPARYKCPYCDKEFDYLASEIIND